MPTNEPVYGWPLPEDTDPVADGASAIRNLAGGISASMRAATPAGPFLLHAARDGGTATQDPISPGVWTELLRLTIPAAPAGEYLIHAHAVFASGAAGTVTTVLYKVEIESPLLVVSGPNRVDPGYQAFHCGLSAPYIHPAGAPAVAKLMAQPQVNGALVIAGGTSMTAQFVRHTGT